MKRQEEIENAAKMKYPYEGGVKGDICQASIPIFVEGAKWADETMIEKAIEWLRENIYNRVYECGDKLGFPTADFIEDFKKAMEE